MEEGLFFNYIRYIILKVKLMKKNLLFIEDIQNLFNLENYYNLIGLD